MGDLREGQQYPRTKGRALNSFTSSVAAADPIEASQSTKGSELNCRARQRFGAHKIKPRKVKNLCLYGLIRTVHTRKH